MKNDAQLRDALRAMMPPASRGRLPDSSILWRKVQLLRRLEAEEQADRVITGVRYGAALAVGAVAGWLFPGIAAGTAWQWATAFASGLLLAALLFAVDQIRSED
jgi:hypothetical protein